MVGVQHAALTMKFEKSMQAVDPAVSLPYWDFTIDTQEILLNHHEQYSKFWFETTVRADHISFLGVSRVSTCSCVRGGGAQPPRAVQQVLVRDHGRCGPQAFGSVSSISHESSLNV